jgi:tetratricopeptide (TPR) repeat protein
MKKRIILLFLLASVCALANPFEDSKLDERIIFYTFNAQWEKADSLLDLKINAEPDNPKYYYLKCPFYFYSRYFNDGVLNGDSLMQLVAKYAHQTIELADKLEPTLENKFYIGSAFGFLSRYYIRQREMWNAYWSSRSERIYLQEVLDQDPDFLDAYLGLAVREYFTATRLQGFYNTLAGILGMSGNRELALEYFKIVAESGNLCKVEANFILASIFRFFESDYTEAQVHSIYLVESFPDNQFLVNQHDEVNLILSIMEKGADFLFAQVDSLEEKYNITSANTLNRVGYNFISQEKLQEAVKIFKLNLKLFPEVANCHDSLAEGYMLMGNNEMAIKYYKMAYEKLPYDETINEAFKEFLKTGIQERLEELGAEPNI